MGPNYAAECAMRCAEPVFWKFLLDVTREKVADKDEAAEAVRKFCDVRSRSQLNEGEHGTDRWLQLRGWFSLWQRGHGRNSKGEQMGPSAMGRSAFGRGSEISMNPFDRPDLDDEEAEASDHDLWAVGWTRARRADESYRRSKC